MYKAVFVEKTTLGNAPDNIKPFILFDAKRRNIELTDESQVVILKIDTSLSYISVPLGFGLSIEAIDAELKEIETELQEKDLSWDGFYIPRRTFYLERWIRHGGWQPDIKLRLFKKSKGYWGGKDPHDKVILDGKAKTLGGLIYHYNYKDLSHQIATIESYSKISSTELFKEGKKFRFSYLLLRPPLRFLRDYILKQGFRDGWPGLIIAVNTSFYVFIKYAKLWELQKKR